MMVGLRTACVTASSRPWRTSSATQNTPARRTIGSAPHLPRYSTARPAAMDRICTLDLMVAGDRLQEAVGMSPLAARSRAPRDADNELYDRGCDLVEAAAAIRRGIDPSGAGVAVPALLGCIEATLHELSRACAGLQQANAQQRELAVTPRSRAIVDRLHHGYSNLGVALEDAEAASGAARALAARRSGTRGHGAH
jgi:hypothetical protein